MRLVTIAMMSVLLQTACGFFSKSKLEPVRVELSKLQAQEGLSLVAVENEGIGIIAFSDRMIKTMRFNQYQLDTYNGTISLDGRLIACAFNEDSEKARESGIDRSLAILRLDGMVLQKYENVRSPSDFSLSHDGKKVVYTATIQTEPEPIRQLQIMNLDSGNIEGVDVQGQTDDPCWSPDGNRVVYEAYDFAAHQSLQ